MQQADLFVATGNYGVSAVGDGGLSDRVWGLQRTRWVPYAVGTKALNRLGQMVDAPANHRPPCLLIYGDTNTGKTLIARKFFKDRNDVPPDTGEHLIRPIVFVQTPPQPDFSTLTGLILAKLNAPAPANSRKERRLLQVLDLMQTARVRMLILDEIHHILASKVDQRAAFLNGLKFLSNELQISIALIGTIEAVRALQTDQQLGNRFEPFHIPRWENGEDYARFLAGCGSAMSIRGGGAWSSKKFVTRFHTMTEGLTGETWRLMCRAAEVAIRSEGEVIDDGALDEVDWKRPSERRNRN